MLLCVQDLSARECVQDKPPAQYSGIRHFSVGCLNIPLRTVATHEVDGAKSLAEVSVTTSGL